LSEESCAIICCPKGAQAKNNSTAGKVNDIIILNIEDEKVKEVLFSWSILINKKSRGSIHLKLPDGDYSLDTALAFARYYIIVV